MIHCAATVTAKVISGRTTKRNARLREHGGGIGDGQRLPEENAAIATFAVQRVEAVEEADDHCGEHEQARDEVVGRHDRLMLSGGRKSAHLTRQMDGADQKTDEKYSGGGEGSDIDRTVLPQLASH